MKNIEKYVDEICETIAECPTCFFIGDCLDCYLNNICCDKEALKEFMMKEAEDDPLLDEPQGTV